MHLYFGMLKSSFIAKVDTFLYIASKKNIISFEETDIKKHPVGNATYFGPQLHQPIG